jgi:hypothetical protein
MQISTSKYQAAHGKMPKGKGLWFFFGMAIGNGLNNSPFEFSHYGTYGEAKKAASKAAKQRTGIHSLTVGS